jgi:hypothetical protein
MLRLYGAPGTLKCKYSGPGLTQHLESLILTAVRSTLNHLGYFVSLTPSATKQIMAQSLTNIEKSRQPAMTSCSGWPA